MNNDRRTKSELIRDLNALRKQVKRLENDLKEISDLKKREKDFTIFDYAMRSISEAITITDEHNTIVFVNESFLKIYGYEREELIGSPIDILRIEKTLPPVREILTATLESGWQGELLNRKKDGSTFPIWLSTSVVRDESGKPLALIGVTTDITERKNAEKARKEAEEALRAGEEYFREIIENVSDIIFVVDQKGIIKYTSPSIERVLGFPVHEVVGKNAFKFIHPSDARRSLVVFWKAIRSKESLIHDTFCIVHKDGSERFLEGLGKNLLDHPFIAGFLMVVHDVTEHRKAEMALRESRDQLRILAARLETIREKERKYIAHEMHEEFGQILSAIKIQMSGLARRYPQDEIFVSGVSELSGFIDEAIQSIRKISTDLWPGVLDLLGITTAIEWQAKEFSKQYKISCNVDVPAKTVHLPERISIVLFRMLQDALKNIAEHAQASSVHIRFMVDAETMELTIEDNGKGITEEQLNSPSSIGLVLLKERALSIGGTAEITSVEGKGTAISIRVPLAG